MNADQPGQSSGTPPAEAKQPDATAEPDSPSGGNDPQDQEYVPL